MPFLGILHLFVAIFFIYHAYNTGRPQFWIFILLFVPLAGSIAYVIFELLPELANSRRARKVFSDVRTVADPDRQWRERKTLADETGSFDAKCKFAEECERKGMWAEAISHYRQAAQGAFSDDPELLRRLARALLGSGDPNGAIEVLDSLRNAHPDFQSQEAHLTYARSLEALGQYREAETEYQALSGYFVGTEARTRYALLMQKMGEPIVAKRLFEQVVKASKARGVVLSPDDWEWIKVAQKNIV